MSVSPEVIHVVRQWVEKAENDLRNAEHTLTLQENCPLDTVCFHAQQCVEKYITALLSLNGINYPKTHNIAELIVLLPKRISPDLTDEEQERLTDYATITRYPGDWEPITRSEAENAVAAARKAREAVRTNLPQETLE